MANSRRQWVSSLADLPRSEQWERGHDVIVRQLAMADRSRWQLNKALEDRGVSEDVRESLLGYFDEQGLIDDRHFAEVLVRYKLGEGKGRHAISKELARKGVDNEIAQAALADIDEDEELEQATRFAVKKLRSASGKPETLYQRTYAALARRGYGAGICSKALRAAKEQIV